MPDYVATLVFILCIAALIFGYIIPEVKWSNLKSTYGRPYIIKSFKRTLITPKKKESTLKDTTINCVLDLSDDEVLPTTDTLFTPEIASRINVDSFVYDFTLYNECERKFNVLNYKTLADVIDNLNKLHPVGSTLVHEQPHYELVAEVREMSRRQETEYTWYDEDERYVHFKRFPSDVKVNDTVLFDPNDRLSNTKGYFPEQEKKKKPFEDNTDTAYWIDDTTNVANHPLFTLNLTCLRKTKPGEKFSMKLTFNYHAKQNKLSLISLS